MRSALTALVLTLASCGSGGSGSGGGSGDPLSPPDDPPELLFCRSRIGTSSDSQIRTASGTGLGDDRIIDRAGVESGVRIAPDGNRMVFVRERRSSTPDSRELFVGTYDGSVAELRLTVDSAVDGGPAWSPDGERIVYASDRLGAGSRLFLIRPDGSDIVALYDDGSEQHAPDWSWTDGRIAFERRAGAGRSEIWVVDADGRVAAPVTDGGVAGGDHDPAWSPDGSSILFVRDAPAGGRSLAVVDLQSGVVDDLTPADGEPRRPRWSPRGDRIFFAADRPEAGIEGLRLWTIRPDGSDRFLVFGDKRHEFLGLDVLADIRPAPAGDIEIIGADVGRATISNGVGRPLHGTAELVIEEDGLSWVIGSIESGGDQIAGIEIDVPLPVADPYDTHAIEVTAVVAVSKPLPESIVRISIANFEAGRNDTVVELTPPDDALRTVTFTIANLQHVSRDARARVAVIAENPLDEPTEFAIDVIRVRVHRPVEDPIESLR